MPVQQIRGEQFHNYPPQAQHVASANITLLQQLPLAFLPLLLREIIVYDWKFPAERDEIDRQVRYLGSLTPDQLSSVMGSFAKLNLSPDLQAMDWVGAPVRFSEKLSAYLWATHQIDDFSRSAEEYIKVFNTAVPEPVIPAPRLGIAVIAEEISKTNYPLFLKLRRKGVYFDHVDPGSNYKLLLDTVTARAKLHPSPYAHWCIEGAEQGTANGSLIAAVAYDSLQPVRKQLIHKMQQVSASQGGPEILRTRLAETEPSELGMKHVIDDPVLSPFAGRGPSPSWPNSPPGKPKNRRTRNSPVCSNTRFSIRQDRWSMRTWGLTTPGSICSGCRVPINPALSRGRQAGERQS